MSIGSVSFRAPNGARLRCASNRRYWVVQTWYDTTPRAIEPAARVTFRTDNLDKARKSARGSGVPKAVFDSVTREWSS